MKSLLKLLAWFWPTKNHWYILITMLPAVFIGLWLLPIGTITYMDFIVLVMVINIWYDVMKLQDKLDSK